MSHIVTIRTQVRDPAALGRACERLGLDGPIEGTFELYEGEVEGCAVSLPGWRYPVVASFDTGELRYDNYGGQWGKQEELDRLLQAYAVEKTIIEARRAGRSVHEQALPDGSVKLTLSA